MKRIKYILFSLLIIFVGILSVDAASLKVSANKSTVVVGSTVKVTVKASGAAGWEYCLSYDSSVFGLESANSDTGGDCVKTGSTLIGYSNVTFTLKAKKSGSSTVGVRAAQMYDDSGSSISSSNSSVTLHAKTQAEIEASYSDNANLSSLSVEDYEISPEFNKDTLEYELTVENDVETVNVVAQKADGNASVKGAGEIELTEGTNKVEILVTAQKGNTKSYIINITRKELNPINVVVDGKNYSVVRKADSLELPPYYSSTTIMMDEEEVPAFESEITGFTLVGLKDEEGNIALYIYNTDGTFTLYESFVTESVTFILLRTDEKLESFDEVEVVINDKTVKAYKLAISDSDYVVVYGMNAKTGEKGWYQYDFREGTFQRYQSSLIVSLQDDVRDYLLMVIVFASGLGLSIILVIILLIMNSRKKRKLVKMLAIKDNGEVIDKKFIVEEVEEDNPFEEKEEVKEELEVEEVEEVEEEIEVDEDEEDGSTQEIETQKDEEQIEDEEDEKEEVVMLDEEDVGGRFNKTEEIDVVEEEQLSKRELRKLEKLRKKEEERKIAKAQKEFLYDSYTSTSVFDTFKDEIEEKEEIEEEKEEKVKKQTRTRKNKKAK